MITFLLNEQPHSIAELDPNTSVLDYLRNHLGRTGTKEGCASGDCGACTVVVGDVVTEDVVTEDVVTGDVATGDVVTGDIATGDVATGDVVTEETVTEETVTGESHGNGIRYRAINACITPIGSLHGKQLITVEDLKDGDQLHPVQQAMVDCHGSQCGFCTPGFVMSLFAYRKNASQPERHAIEEALSGNLCRCTGYRPIIDAAVQMFTPPPEDTFSANEAEVMTALKRIEQEQPKAKLHSNGKRFLSPTTLEELAELLERYPQARLIAGGTDLSLEITQMLRDIEVLIDVNRIAALQTLALNDSNLEIGAAVTYSKAREALTSLYPDLHELIDRLGSRQIRNRGTIGGNIGNASPIGDLPPVLIALGAQLVLRKNNITRTLPVEDYFIRYKVTAQQPGEFIEKILLPRPRPGYQFRVYKISKRLDDDISATCGAFHLCIENGAVNDVAIVNDVVIAFGGMAEIPKRAKHCEQALHGQPWNENTIENAATALTKDFTPIGDCRASANYRLRVSQNLLRRLYLELKNVPTRVTQYA